MPRPTRTRFTGARGETLAAILDEPDGEARGHALFAHCFTCGKDLKAAHWLGQALAARGIAMLRFDFAGLGQSEGDFSESSLSANVEDLVAAGEHLAREHGPARLLVGHSLGGLAALAAASEMPDVRAVCTISSSFRASHLRRYIDPGEAADRFTVTIAGRKLQLRRGFLEDLERHDMAAHIAGLGRPLLVMHAPEDEVVELAQAEQIFAAARQPKSLVALDGAGHLLMRRDQAERAAGIIAAWAAPYLG